MAGGDGMETRHAFVASVSGAFAPDAVAATAAKVAPLDPSHDHLDILHRLGLLPWVGAEPGALQRYRDSLGIPPLNQAVITQVLQYCLQHQPAPIPLRMSVVESATEEVSVSVTADAVYLRIGRTSYR